MIGIRSWLLVTGLLMAVGISGCAYLWGPSEQVRQDAAAQILSIYAMPDMLAQVAPIISDSLKMNLPPSVTDAEHDRLLQAIAQSYQRDVLVAAMNQRLREKASAENRAGVLLKAAAKLDSPLVNDMIALERKAGTAEFSAGYDDFLRGPVDEANKPRLLKTGRLVVSMGLVDLQLAFNVGMLKGMINARNTVVEAADRTSPAIARQMAERTRGSLRRNLLQELPLMLFYAYRTVPDAKLERYVALHDSPALAWVNKAIPEVLKQVLENASQQLAERYAGLREAPAG